MAPPAEIKERIQALEASVRSGVEHINDLAPLMALCDPGAPTDEPDVALSALHAFLFGGPGARTADHWRAIGGVIASRGGVVAPEELAPHLPAPPMNLRDSEAAAAVAVVLMVAVAVVTGTEALPV